MQKDSQDVVALLETLKAAQFIDLSHPIDENTPVVRLEGQFEGMTRESVITVKEHGAAKDNYTISSHTGTFVRTGAVFQEDIPSVNERALQDYVLLGRQVGATEGKVTLADIKAAEEKQGEIQEGALLLVASGLGGKWADKDLFVTAAGEAKVSVEIAEDALDYVLKERKVAGIGHEGLFLGAATEETVLKAGKILVGMLDLSKTEGHGVIVYVMPMKIEKAAEAPARVFASLFHS